MWATKSTAQAEIATSLWTMAVTMLYTRSKSKLSQEQCQEIGLVLLIHSSCQQRMWFISGMELAETAISTIATVDSSHRFQWLLIRKLSWISLDLMVKMTPISPKRQILRDEEFLSKSMLSLRLANLRMSKWRKWKVSWQWEETKVNIFSIQKQFSRKLKKTIMYSIKNKKKLNQLYQGHQVM